MNIYIVSDHFELTDAIKDHIHQKIEKLVTFFDINPDLHMTLSLPQKHIHIADLSCKIKKDFIKARAESKDMYHSIDQAIHKIEKSLKKTQEKLKHHPEKHPLKKQEVLLEEDSLDDDLSGPLDHLSPKNVVYKKVVLKVMSLQEAIEEYEDSQKDIMIFKRLDKQTVHVLRTKEKNSLEIIEIINR